MSKYKLDDPRMVPFDGEKLDLIDRYLARKKCFISKLCRRAGVNHSYLYGIMRKFQNEGQANILDEAWERIKREVGR